MSAASVLSAVGNDLKSFYAKLSSDLQKAKQAWIMISSAQTRAILVKIGSDAIKAVQDATTSVLSGGLALNLDAAAIADIKQLIADAHAGDGVIATDLAALGIKF